MRKKKEKNSKTEKTKKSREPMISTPCVPKQLDTIVRIADQSDVLSIIFENIKTGQVEKITWNIKRGEYYCSLSMYIYHQ